MYISHFAFLWVALQLFNKVKLNIGDDLSAILAFVFVAILSFLFSKVSYTIVEAPFIKIGRKLANRFNKDDYTQHVPSMEIIGSK